MVRDFMIIKIHLLWIMHHSGYQKNVPVCLRGGVLSQAESEHNNDRHAPAIKSFYKLSGIHVLDDVAQFGEDERLAGQLAGL